MVQKVVDDELEDFPCISIFEIMCLSFVPFGFNLKLNNHLG